MAGRARRFFRKHGSSMKVTGIQAAGGMAVALLDKQILSSESGQKMFGDSTYVKPLVVLAGAHFIKSKAPNLGAGMAGAAGFMLATAYYENNESSDNNAKGIVEVGALHNYPPAFAPGGGYRGAYDEAGAVFEVVR